MSGRRRLVTIVLVLTALFAAIGVLREMSGAGRQRRQVEGLREELRALRAAADSCAAALAQEDARFRAFDAEIDSLRRAVRSYEAQHEDGVLAKDYEAYLETFDRYNAGVPVWEDRADSLRSHWAACRAVTERHNELVESLREPTPPDVTDQPPSSSL